MPLTLRPTGLVSPVYGHLQDWTIFEDGKPVGRIYEDVSERVVGQPLTGARDLRDSGAYCDYGQSVAKIGFEARPMKAGQDWMVVATFPDRPELHVSDFPTEADARNWIINDSQEWLKKLGYDHE
jgi:hypothetical protein